MKMAKKYIKPHDDFRFEFPAGTKLSIQQRSAVLDLRQVRPTAADQKRNPNLDLMAIWMDDIEHTIRCKEWPADIAQEFRSACTARVTTEDAP
jgi:hypothetical protein